MPPPEVQPRLDFSDLNPVDLSITNPSQPQPIDLSIPPPITEPLQFVKSPSLEEETRDLVDPQKQQKRLPPTIDLSDLPDIGIGDESPQAPSDRITYQPTDAIWSLRRLGEVKNYFQQTFGRELPIASIGEGRIHKKWGLNHEGSADISVDPTSNEGKALQDFLRKNKIPFTAFTHAIPGVATDKHIHVGFPSTRSQANKNIPLGATNQADQSRGSSPVVDTTNIGEPPIVTQAKESPTFKKQYALPGPYFTQLTPQDEAQFQDWVKKNNIPWQDSPTSDYNMRGFWFATKNDDPQLLQTPWPKGKHFPDTWKTPWHATFSNESVYADQSTKPPQWKKDSSGTWQLVDNKGNIIADYGAENVSAATIPPNTKTPVLDLSDLSTVNVSDTGITPAKTPEELLKESPTTPVDLKKLPFEGSKADMPWTSKALAWMVQDSKPPLEADDPNEMGDPISVIIGRPSDRAPTTDQLTDAWLMAWDQIYHTKYKELNDLYRIENRGLNIATVQGRDSYTFMSDNKLLVQARPTRGVKALFEGYRTGGTKGYEETLKQINKRTEEINKHQIEFKENKETYEAAHPYITGLISATIQGETAVDTDILTNLKYLGKAMFTLYTKGAESKDMMDLANAEYKDRKQIQEMKTGIYVSPTFGGRTFGAVAGFITSLPRYEASLAVGTALGGPTGVGLTLGGMHVLEHIQNGGIDTVITAYPMAIAGAFLHGAGDFTSGYEKTGTIRSFLRDSERGGINKFEYLGEKGEGPLMSERAYHVETVNETGGTRAPFTIVPKNPAQFQTSPLFTSENMSILRNKLMEGESVSIQNLTPFARQVFLRGSNALLAGATTAVSHFANIPKPLANIDDPNKFGKELFSKEGWEKFLQEGLQNVIVSLFPPVGKGVGEFKPAEYSGYERLRGPIFNVHGPFKPTVELPITEPPKYPIVGERTQQLTKLPTEYKAGVSSDPYVNVLAETEYGFQIVSPHGEGTPMSIRIPLDDAALHLIELRRMVKDGTWKNGNETPEELVAKERAIDDSILALSQAVPKVVMPFFEQNENAIRMAITENQKRASVDQKRVLQEGELLSPSQIVPIRPLIPVITTGTETTRELFAGKMGDNNPWSTQEQAHKWLKELYDYSGANLTGEGGQKSYGVPIPYADVFAKKFSALVGLTEFAIEDGMMRGAIPSVKEVTKTLKTMLGRFGDYLTDDVAERAYLEGKKYFNANVANAFYSRMKQDVLENLPHVDVVDPTTKTSSMMVEKMADTPEKYRPAKTFTDKKGNVINVPEQRVAKVEGRSAVNRVRDVLDRHPNESLWITGLDDFLHQYDPGQPKEGQSVNKSELMDLIANSQLKVDVTYVGKQTNKELALQQQINQLPPMSELHRMSDELNVAAAASGTYINIGSRIIRGEIESIRSMIPADQVALADVLNRLATKRNDLTAELNAERANRLSTHYGGGRYEMSGGIANTYKEVIVSYPEDPPASAGVTPRQLEELAVKNMQDRIRSDIDNNTSYTYYDEADQVRYLGSVYKPIVGDTSIADSINDYGENPLDVHNARVMDFPEYEDIKNARRTLGIDEFFDAQALRGTPEYDQMITIPSPWRFKDPHEWSQPRSMGGSGIKNNITHYRANDRVFTDKLTGIIQSAYNAEEFQTDWGNYITKGYNSQLDAILRLAGLNIEYNPYNANLKYTGPADKIAAINRKADALQRSEEVSNTPRSERDSEVIRARLEETSQGLENIVKRAPYDTSAIKDWKVTGMDIADPSYPQGRQQIYGGIDISSAEERQQIFGGIKRKPFKDFQEAKAIGYKIELVEQYSPTDARYSLVSPNGNYMDSFRGRSIDEAETQFTDMLNDLRIGKGLPSHEPLQNPNPFMVNNWKELIAKQFLHDAVVAKNPEYRPQARVVPNTMYANDPSNFIIVDMATNEKLADGNVFNTEGEARAFLDSRRWLKEYKYDYITWLPQEIHTPRNMKGEWTRGVKWSKNLDGTYNIEIAKTPYDAASGNYVNQGGYSGHRGELDNLTLEKLKVVTGISGDDIWKKIQEEENKTVDQYIVKSGNTTYGTYRTEAEAQDRINVMMDSTRANARIEKESQPAMQGEFLLPKRMAVSWIGRAQYGDYDNAFKAIFKQIARRFSKKGEELYSEQEYPTGERGDSTVNYIGQDYTYLEIENMKNAIEQSIGRYSDEYNILSDVQWYMTNRGTDMAGAVEGILDRGRMHGSGTSEVELLQKTIQDQIGSTDPLMEITENMTQQKVHAIKINDAMRFSLSTEGQPHYGVGGFDKTKSVETGVRNRQKSSEFANTHLEDLVSSMEEMVPPFKPESLLSDKENNQLKAAIANNDMETIQEMQNRIQSRKPTIFNTGLSPQAWIDQTKLLYRGMKDFQEFSNALVQQYGDKVKPFLSDLWMEVKDSAKEFWLDDDGSLPAMRGRKTKEEREQSKQLREDTSKQADGLKKTIQDKLSLEDAEIKDLSDSQIANKVGQLLLKYADAVGVSPHGYDDPDAVPVLKQQIDVLNAEMEKRIAEHRAFRGRVEEAGKRRDVYSNEGLLSEVQKRLTEETGVPIEPVPEKYPISIYIGPPDPNRDQYFTINIDGKDHHVVPNKVAETAVRQLMGQEENPDIEDVKASNYLLKKYPEIMEAAKKAYKSANKFLKDDEGALKLPKFGTPLTEAGKKAKAKREPILDDPRLMRGIMIAQRFPLAAEVYNITRYGQRDRNQFEYNNIRDLDLANKIVKQGLQQPVAETIFIGNETQRLFNDTELAAGDPALNRPALNPDQIQAYKDVYRAIHRSLDKRANQMLFSYRERATRLNDRLQALNSADPDFANKQQALHTQILDNADAINDVVKHYQDLKDQGYISLQRKGRWAAFVHDPLFQVGDPQGRVYQHFDSFKEADAWVDQQQRGLGAASSESRITDTHDLAQLRKLSSGMSPSQFENLIDAAGVNSNDPAIEGLRDEIYSRYPSKGYELSRDYVRGYDRNWEFVIKSVADQTYVYGNSFYARVAGELAGKQLEASGLSTTHPVLHRVMARYIEHEIAAPSQEWGSKFWTVARKGTYLYQIGNDFRQFYLNALAQPVTQSYSYFARVEHNGVKLSAGEAEKYFIAGAHLADKVASDILLGTGRTPRDFEQIRQRLIAEGVIAGDLNKLYVEGGSLPDVQSKLKSKNSLKLIEHWSGGFMRAGEKTTRTHVAAEAFLVGKEKFGLQNEELVDFIVRAVDATQSNNSRAEAPYYVRGERNTAEGRKLLYMFNTFNDMWLNNFALNLRADLQSRNIVGSAVARQMIPAALMGGLKNLPLAGVAAALYTLVTGKDPDEEFHKAMKNHQQLEKIALHGMTGNATLGAQLAPSLPYSNLFKLGKDVPSTLDNTLEFANIPTVATYGQILRGLYDLGVKDEYLRGAAGLPFPKLARNMINVERLRRHGVMTRGGETLLPKNKVTAFDLIMQAIGNPPSVQTEYYEKKENEMRTTLMRGVRGEIQRRVKQIKKKL